jgi:tryptophan synthase alpha chain
MAEFFRPTTRRHPGLALFLNAGDPPLDVLADVAQMLDDAEVDCLELAVPFPDSVTDGPVVRRSAARALAAGTGIDDLLSFVARVRPRLRHLRIALLADWSYTVRHHRDFEHRVAGAGADGILVHGLPPRAREAHRLAAAAAELPMVTTCYPTSDRMVRTYAARHASAYLYLVAAYGRSGTRPADGYAGLAGVLAELRAATRAPIAVGFGVRSPADLATLAGIGADAAVVGSAAVAVIERALGTHRDVVRDLADFVRGLAEVGQSQQEVH